jgi:hypothetical protein
LVLNNHSVCVWNRRGVIVARQPAALGTPGAPGAPAPADTAGACETQAASGPPGTVAGPADPFLEEFENLVELIRDFRHLTDRNSTAKENLKLIEECDELTNRMVGVMRRLAQPENLVLRRFFEAGRRREMLDMLRAVHHAAASRDVSRKQHRSLHEIMNLQRIMHVIEYFVVAAYFAEMYHLVIQQPHGQAEGRGINWGVILSSAVGFLLVFLVSCFVTRGHSISLWCCERIRRFCRGVREETEP